MKIGIAAYGGKVYFLDATIKTILCAVTPEVADSIAEALPGAAQQARYLVTDEDATEPKVDAVPVADETAKFTGSDRDWLESLTLKL